MKQRLFLFLSFILCVFIAFTQRSNFTISTTGKSNLKILFAGKKYSLQDRSCTYQSLTPGKYTLTVYQQQPTQTGEDYVSVYNGSITLTGGKHLELTILRFGKAVWDEGLIAKDNWNENYINPEPVNNNNSGSEFEQNKNDREGWIVADEAQMNKIKKALNAEYFSDSKLKIAKVVVKNVWLTTDQIQEIMKLISEDVKMLEFAKHAYNNCSDKSNYYILGDAFFFSDNKKKLIDFISNQ